MRVKIGDKVYNSDDEPIMVMLSDQEKQLISDMPKHLHKFLVYPDSMSIEDAQGFMVTNKGGK